LGPSNPVAWKDGPGQKTKRVPAIINSKGLWIPKTPPKGGIGDCLDKRRVEGVNGSGTSAGCLVTGEVEDVGEDRYAKSDGESSRWTQKFVGCCEGVEGCCIWAFRVVRHDDAN
jgi:hypothetical protein